MDLYRSDKFSPTLKGCNPQVHFTLSTQNIYEFSVIFNIMKQSFPEHK
jgi:hypothetical protein